MTPILPLGYHEPLQSLHTLFAAFSKGARAVGPASPPRKPQSQRIPVHVQGTFTAW